MKNFCALFFCILFTAACHMLGWGLLLKGFGSFFLFYISPAISAAGFFLLGKFFCKKLGMNRKALWLTMNILGDIVGWIGLFIVAERIPEVLKYRFFYIVFYRLFVFAVIWGVIWGASAISHRLESQGVNFYQMLLKGVGMLLFLLSLGMVGVSYYIQQHSTDSYEAVLILLISGLYTIGYVYFWLRGREKQRQKVE